MEGLADIIQQPVSVLRTEQWEKLLEYEIKELVALFLI